MCCSCNTSVVKKLWHIWHSIFGWAISQCLIKTSTCKKADYISYMTIFVTVIHMVVSHNLNIYTCLLHCKYLHVHHMYTMYQIFYHIFYMSMNFYKFYSDYDVVLHYQTLFYILSTVSHSGHYFLHFLLFQISQHQPKIVYIKMWNGQVIIHKNIYYCLTHDYKNVYTYSFM